MSKIYFIFFVLIIFVSGNAGASAKTQANNNCTNKCQNQSYAAGWCLKKKKTVKPSIGQNYRCEDKHCACCSYDDYNENLNGKCRKGGVQSGIPAWKNFKDGKYRDKRLRS